MVKLFLMVLCVVVAVAPAFCVSELTEFIDTASAEAGCNWFGSNDACARLFYLQHKTEIMICAAVLAVLALTGCAWCCGCCNRKTEVVYLQMPRPNV